MFNDKLSFFTNNVKGIKTSEKRLKLFEYFRNLKHSFGGFVFLQETHFSVDVEKNGTLIFKDNSFFHTVKQILVESV